MTAAVFVDHLPQLLVDGSLSRPRVSNDNPFSKSCFQTVKYQPEYPGWLQDVGHARQWFTALFEYCVHHPRHPGLALITLPNVFFGRTHQLVAVRKRTLEAAFQAHPGRFVR